jgi:hypothetical protein
MTTPELEAEIARLFYSEHWKVGTIVAQLGTHPDVVRRVLGIGVAHASAASPRVRMVDPYRAFIDETLTRYPRLRATRLHVRIPVAFDHRFWPHLITGSGSIRSPILGT